MLEQKKKEEEEAAEAEKQADKESENDSGMEEGDGPLEDWTRKELADECKTLGLSDKGVKAVLIARVKEAKASPEPAVEETPVEEAAEEEPAAVEEPVVEEAVPEEAPVEEAVVEEPDHGHQQCQEEVHDWDLSLWVPWHHQAQGEHCGESLNNK